MHWSSQHTSFFNKLKQKTFPGRQISKHLVLREAMHHSKGITRLPPSVGVIDVYILQLFTRIKENIFVKNSAPDRRHADNVIDVEWRQIVIKMFLIVLDILLPIKCPYFMLAALYLLPRNKKLMMILIPKLLHVSNLTSIYLISTRKRNLETFSQLFISSTFFSL